MDLKKCNKCGKLLPKTEFHKHLAAPDGLRYSCKKCSNVIIAEYRKKYAKKYKENMQKWRDKNRTKLREQAQTPHRKEYMRQWRQKPENKAKAAARLRKYREEKPEIRAKIQRKSILKSSYGVTPEWYDNTLKKQNGRCAICESDNPGRKNTKFFSIDHNHETGQIRGLLCFRCNSMIGYAKERKGILKKAIEYLKKFNVE